MSIVMPKKNDMALDLIRDAGVAGVSVATIAEHLHSGIKSTVGILRKMELAGKVEWYKAKGDRYYRLVNDKSRTASKLRDDVLAILHQGPATVDHLSHVLAVDKERILSVMRSIQQAGAAVRKGPMWHIKGRAKVEDKPERALPWTHGTMPVLTDFRAIRMPEPVRPGAMDALLVPSLNVDGSTRPSFTAQLEERRRAS